jgi:DNA-binding MarR family transcriptional regulator/N-acetylglutamate synthase-like GNAT family acetyltransferase
MATPNSVSRQRIDSIRTFNRFYTRRIGVVGAGLLDTGYSLTEVRVLYEIAHRDEVLAADLVRDLALDAGYLSRILLRFRERGWLTRERSQADGRRSQLLLTPRGKKMAASLEARARGEIGKLLAPLPVGQQVRLQSHLESVQALLGGATAGSPGITLREHRAGDMGWIIQQHGALYTQEYGWNEQFEALVAGICVNFLRNFDPSCERCWIAECAGVAVGCIMLVRSSRTIGKLRLLLVDPSQRGRGIGDKLVTECLAFARAAGYRKIVLWTQRNLAAARRIYEAHGFKLVKSEPHDSFGAKLVGEFWELPLLPARRSK